MAELYEWTYDGATLRQTSAMLSKAKDGHSYAPAVLSRSEIAYSTALDSAPVTVTTTASHEVAMSFRGLPPVAVTLTLYRGRGGDWQRIWTGRVTAVSLRGQSAEITVEPPQTTMRTRGLPQSYAKTCRHRLYDGRCAAQQATIDGVNPLNPPRATKVSFIVSGIVRNAVELLGFADWIRDAKAIVPGHADRFFVGGIATFGTAQRLIVSHGGTIAPGPTPDAVTLHAGFEGLTVGDTVVLLAGCDHEFRTCDGKFKNGARFGGFPYLPALNPFEGGG